MQIRAATVAQLQAAGMATGDRVFGSRVLPFQQAELPAASVYTRGEQIAQIVEEPRAHRRTTELVVELAADALSGQVDDELDLLAHAAEGAIWGDETLGGCATELEFLRVEGPTLEANGNLVIGAVALVFGATYEAEAPRAEVADEFQVAEVDYETHEPRPGPEAEDTITVPQD